MAILLDGVNDKATYGDVASIDGATNYSIAVWAYRPAAVANNQGLVGKSTTSSWVNSGCLGSGGPGGSGTTNDKMVMWFDSSSNWTFAQMPAATIVNGQWHHYAFSYDGAGAADADKVKGYWDGVSQTLSFGVLAVPATLPDSGAAPFGIGFFNNSGYNYGQFNIGAVKAWNATLTAAELYNEMTSKYPCRTANLLIWIPGDDGNSMKDYFGGNAVTITEAIQATMSPPF